MWERGEGKGGMREERGRVGGEGRGEGRGRRVDVFMYAIVNVSATLDCIMRCMYPNP